MKIVCDIQNVLIIYLLSISINRNNIQKYGKKEKSESERI
jgi:hypothetical protein